MYRPNSLAMDFMDNSLELTMNKRVCYTTTLALKNHEENSKIEGTEKWMKSSCGF